MLLLIFQTNHLTAEANIDSLKLVLQNEHDLEKKAQLYIQLGQALKTSDLDKAGKNADQALILLNKTDNRKLVGLAFALLGEVSFLQDSLDKAETAFKVAIPLLTETGEHHALIAACLTMGNRYIEKANYPEAMEYYLKGLSHAEQIHDSVYLPRLYNNLGVVYLNQNNYKKALEYYTNALKAFEALGDSSNVAGTTTNIGSIYIELKDYDIAKDYYQKGLALFTKIKYEPGQAHALFKLGLLEKMRGRYREALNYLFEISSDALKHTQTSKSIIKTIYTERSLIF